MTPRKAKPKLGRPTDDPRKHFVAVRLTDAELEALQRVRRSGEFAYLSDALRSLIPVKAK